MKFKNCDIDLDDLDDLAARGAIKIKSTDGVDADFSFESNELNQMQTNKLVDYMYQVVLLICGMPNRNGGSSTSDTGAAVIMRDGWESAEARAKASEIIFRQSEYEFLRLVLRLLRGTVGTSLQTERYINQIHSSGIMRTYWQKAQVLTTMTTNPNIHPFKLGFIHCGLFSDPEEAYSESRLGGGTESKAGRIIRPMKIPPDNENGNEPG